MHRNKSYSYHQIVIFTHPLPSILCCRGEVYGFKYWSDPGAFSNGVLGVINALVLAALTMTGVEIVGVTAGESKNPSKSIPNAVRNVFYRIVCIYLSTGKGREGI